MGKEDGVASSRGKTGGARPKLPMGVSNFVPIRSIWGNDEMKTSEKEWFISTRISKYIEFWKLGMSKDDSYSKVMGPYVKY